MFINKCTEKALISFLSNQEQNAVNNHGDNAALTMPDVQELKIINSAIDVYCQHGLVEISVNCPGSL